MRDAVAPPATGPSRNALGATRASDPEQGGDVVVMHVGGDIYAVRAGTVREVVRAPEVTPLPASSPIFLGVCNVRGDIVPVLDTFALLGLGAGPTFTHAVIVRASEGEVGLSTTGVPEFTQLGDRVGDGDVAGRLGAYRVSAGIATLLDLDALVTRGRLDGA